MRKLHDLLTENAQSGVYPMHMPGHKRNPAFGDGLPIGEDVTEVEGFDDLHEPTSILKELSARLSGLWGADTAFPTVGGSTCGLLSAVRALTKYGDRVLMARNCHKSVYHAAELCGLSVTYLLPEQSDGLLGSVSPDAVRAALAADPSIRLVILTSPTYEGVVSDVSSIAAVAHAAGIPLLVDAAHGAHFGFSAEFPRSPVMLGADVTVMSLHKTLPSVTGTALVACRARYADEIKHELAVFETSSPSYLMLESVENCVEILEERSRELFATYADRLRRFRVRASAWKRLRLYNGDGAFGYDPGKLVVLTGSVPMTGVRLAAILRETYRIETEMAYPGYVICMTSICDTDEGFARLADALSEIDATYRDCAGTVKRVGNPGSFLPEIRLTAAVARDTDKTPMVPADAVGRISGEYLWAYPPGIPLIVPGEVIEPRLFDATRVLTEGGVPVRSTSGGFPQTILTLRRKSS